MILVTGGTGLVGRSLVERLVARGESVRVLTRDRAHAIGFPHTVGVAVGDLRDAVSLARVLDGVATIVHLAAAVPGAAAADRDHFRVNVECARTIARLARASGATRFVHGSSAGVYGDGVSRALHNEESPAAGRSDYERSKLESERAVIDELAASRVRWVVLRPTGVYGPRRPATLAFYRAVAQTRVWLHGPGRVIVHPTHVDDVVRAIEGVLERPDLSGEVFNVGGARPLPYQELIAMVGRMLGRRVIQMTLPGPPVRVVARLVGSASRLAGVRPSDRLARLEHPIVNRAVDISKARRLLGFEPRPLEDGLRETIGAFKANGQL